MLTKFGQIVLTVRDYEEALDFYVQKLGFAKIEDRLIGPGMRWVVIAPNASNETVIVLEEAKSAEDHKRLGKQFGGMALTIETDDLDQAYQRMVSNGIKFVEAPNDAPWGRQAAFQDLYGNVFDLLERRRDRKF